MGGVLEQRALAVNCVRPVRRVRVEQLVPLTIDFATIHGSVSNSGRSVEAMVCSSRSTADDPASTQKLGQLGAARWSQVLTVPTGRVTARAISSYDRFCSWNRTKTRRYSGRSRLRACSSSPARSSGSAGPARGSDNSSAGPASARAAAARGEPVRFGSGWRRSPAARAAAAARHRSPPSIAARGRTFPARHPRRPAGGSSCGSTGRRRPPDIARSAGELPADCRTGALRPARRRPSASRCGRIRPRSRPKPSGRS